MRHIIYLGITLALLWLSLSGFFTPLMLSFGLASVVLVLFIVHRMDVVDHEGHPVHLRPIHLVLFWLWLLREVVVANLAVARIILSPKMPISPTLTEVDIDELSEVGRVTFANAITLTPGSLTTELTPAGKLTAHTLTRETAEGVASSSLGRRLAVVEEGWQQVKVD